MPDIYYDVDVALAAVPLNKVPVVDVDGLTVDTGMVYNEAGLSVEWNFVTSAGAFTHTAVTPTDTAGDYDFVNQGEGMYTIEIPASGGATINNDTEGYGWFSCNCTANLPWVSPVFGFRAAAINDALCDGGDILDVNTTQFAGTAQTAGKDVSNIVDTILLDTGELQTDWQNGGRLDLLIDAIKAVTDLLPDAGALSSLATAAALSTTDGKVDTVDANVDLILADTGTDGVVISTATAQAIADELLKRDFSAVTGEAARSALNALRFLRNKWSISATTLTVTEEDDSTPAWTATVTTDAGADPVTGNDPA